MKKRHKNKMGDGRRKGVEVFRRQNDGGTERKREKGTNRSKGRWTSQELVVPEGHLWVLPVRLPSDVSLGQDLPFPTPSPHDLVG